MFFIFFLNAFFHIVFGSVLVYFLGSVFFFFLTYSNLVLFVLSSFVPFLIPFCLIFSFFNKNPVNALLLILLSFILSSFLLFQVASEMLTFIFLIVYIGALMMLFLFVIMLFNLQQITNSFKDFNK